MSRNPEVGTAPIAPPPLPTSQFGNPATFTAAANTQGSDYDKIMAQYDDLAKSSTTNPITASPISPTTISTPGSINFRSIAPQTTNYQQSGDVTNSLSDLSTLAATGGYSDANIADIRARDTSPIRSIYSSAQENVSRQRALAGGYSPNFNATQAKLARDESAQIGDTVTNANAGIAQNVASNKLAAAAPYASAAGSANAQQAQADQANAAIINEINALNAQGEMQANEFNTSTAASIAAANAAAANSTSQFNSSTALDAAKANRSITAGALGGKTSLYGTTPALVNTFGNQVVQAGQLGQNQSQINNQKQSQILNAGTRGGIY